MKATTDKELAQNIKNGVDEFEITIDLKEKVLKFKARTDKIPAIAWTIAFGAIASAIALYIATPAATAITAGTGGAISFTGATAFAGGAIAILGISATTFAISLGIAAGGVGVIAKLRNRYEVVEKYGSFYMRRK